MSTLKTTVGDNSYHIDKNNNSGDSDDGRGGGQGRKKEKKEKKVDTNKDKEKIEEGGQEERGGAYRGLG